MFINQSIIKIYGKDVSRHKIEVDIKLGRVTILLTTLETTEKNSESKRKKEEIGGGEIFELTRED